METQGTGKIKVETFWKEHCSYCKKNEPCKFHRIFNDYNIEPSKVDFIDVRKFDHGKKYSIRIVYIGKLNENVEISLAIPSNQLTVIVGNGKERKSLLTLIYSDTIFHELFLIAKEEEIKKFKTISNENFKKIYKNAIGD
ncbi:MAG: hypothetical protein ACP5TO_04840 [Thermoplasmata archaeon]